MGANVSAGTLLLCDTTNFDGPSTRPRLGDVPESCIALVLTHLDPLEICKLAKLNRSFRGASSADFLWESKLPRNYESILERVFEHGEYTTMVDLRKKDVYEHVAYLQHIWWLEVDGELEFPFPEGTYSLFFRLHLGKPSKKLGRRICNTNHIHGWDVKPVQFRLSTSDGQKTESKCFLENPGTWVHYHAGDFEIKNRTQLIKIKFSLTQIDCTHIKGGLCVDSAVVFPRSMSSKWMKKQREDVNRVCSYTMGLVNL